MPKPPSTTARLTAGQRYLEDEYPGHVEKVSEGTGIDHVDQRREP